MIGITVYDVLGWLAAGMSTAEIIDDFPELTETDIRACLEFATDRDHRLIYTLPNSSSAFPNAIPGCAACF